MSANPLADQLLSDARRDAVVADAVRQVEAHVKSRGGLRGLSLRAALALLRSVRPDALTRAIGLLLPQWVAVLEPHYADFRAARERDFSAFLKTRSASVAEELTGVIDRRVAQSPNAALKAGYGRLRKDIVKEMADTVPDLARSLQRHLD